MTLPTNITLPLAPSSRELSLSEIQTYLQRLVYAISLNLQNINVVENGTFNLLTDSSNYQFIQGSSSAGTATYATTTMYTRRINLNIYTWFDITWSGSTGTGNTLIQLPYFSQNVPNNPFCCVIESDGMTFSAGYTYLTGNITPNTNTIAVNQNGSGVPLLAFPLAADGHLRGSIVYAGQQFI